MTPEYPSNSNKSKEENKQRLDAVIDSPAKVRKKKTNKLLRFIFARDLADIQQEIMTEYIRPKSKDLTWELLQAGIDIFKNAIKMAIYENYKPADTSRLPAERYSYSGYYNQGTTVRPTMTTELNYDEFIYDSYGKATAVLDALRDRINGPYKCATVLDLYDASKISTSNYTLQDYGWTNLDFAEVRQGEAGYIIALPKAKPLKR